MLSLEKVFASLPKTERGKAFVISGDPKGKTFLYANGTSIYIRDLKDPYSVCDIYTQHSAATTVARYSPSGFYICSGDVSGKIRIWDTTQLEHILKNEFHALGGGVRDVAWTSDSQRLIVVGDGREKFGVAILADAGSSVGEIMGHAKPINSVDIRRDRPFRAVTAGEDFITCFFEGPPFKFKKQNEEHTNFINVVRYAPNGEVFATGASSGKIFLYEGKTSEFVGEVGDPAHKGGVYSLDFSPSSDQLVSASGDKTVRLWNLTDKSLVGEWVFGKTINEMQLSCVWIGDVILSSQLSGAIHFIDPKQPGKPLQTLLGHNKPITALDKNSEGSHIVTGSSDGSCVIWDVSSGRMQALEGLKHTNQIQDLVVTSSGVVCTVSMDDTYLTSDLSTGSCTQSPQKLDSQPRGIASCGDLVIIVCLHHISVYRGNSLVKTQKSPSELECCSLSPDGAFLAVGSSDKNCIYIYSVAEGNLQLTNTLSDLGGSVECVCYSPDGAVLACGLSNRYVKVFSVEANYSLANSEDWCFQNAKVNCIAFTPNSKFVASGSLDCSIYVWSLEEPKKRVAMKNAHPMSQITGLCWVTDDRLVSTGHDSNIKIWKVQFS